MGNQQPSFEEKKVQRLSFTEQGNRKGRGLQRSRYSLLFAETQSTKDLQKYTPSVYEKAKAYAANITATLTRFRLTGFAMGSYSATSDGPYYTFNGSEYVEVQLPTAYTLDSINNYLSANNHFNDDKYVDKKIDVSVSRLGDLADGQFAPQGQISVLEKWPTYKAQVLNLAQITSLASGGGTQ